MMKILLNLKTLLLLFYAAICFAQRRNVLFLVADDMRPDIGVYSKPGDSPIYTPNIDALAGRSLLMKRAYCQQALCAPSRTSLLTGRRPETTKVSDLYQYWRKVGGNFTTIPQHFKENGYATIGLGKVFHPGHSSNDDDPISWTEIFQPNNSYWTARNTESWHAADVQETLDYPLQDMQVTTHAIETLETLAPKALSGEEPFFLAVGFNKPHLPFMCPSNFFDLYPENETRLPDNPYAPYGMPERAWSYYQELREYSDIGTNFGYGCINTTLPDYKVKELRRAYYATITYVDSLLGQVIQTLDNLGLSNNTVISFFGDHGWQLGEHGEWSKQTNFELATHAPMMVSVPGLTDQGVVTDRLVEFVDLFPTLAEAAGVPLVPLCPEQSSNVTLCSEGISMVPLMQDPDRPWKSAAFSQCPRGDMGGTVMGYNIRTANYSYTEWVEYDVYQAIPAVPSGVFSAELYDHVVDPDENVNRVGYTEYAVIEEQLIAQLHAGWRSALPQPSNTEKVSAEDSINNVNYKEGVAKRKSLKTHLEEGWRQTRDAV